MGPSLFPSLDGQRLRAGSPTRMANGAADGQQVAFARGPATGNNAHAMLWRGTAASAMDLNAFLPSGFTNAQATGIDQNRDIVGFARGPATGDKS